MKAHSLRKDMVYRRQNKLRFLHTDQIACLFGKVGKLMNTRTETSVNEDMDIFGGLPLGLNR